MTKFQIVAGSILGAVAFYFVFWLPVFLGIGY